MAIWRVFFNMDLSLPPNINLSKSSFMVDFWVDWMIYMGLLIDKGTVDDSLKDLMGFVH